MKIIVKNITKEFLSGMNSKMKAIDSVSTEFNQGEFIGVIGHTGSGKTTFIEHLNALLIPSQGELIIDGKVIKKSWRKIKKVEEIRKKIGIVFQFAEYQLFEETIEKDIIFGPITMGVTKEEAIEIAKEIIVEVGLPIEFLSKSPFELSGGQKRRVALAGIMAMKPDFLVFDEPTAGLDPAGAHDILELFKKMHKNGKTIIIVTHDLDNVLQYTDRTLMFCDGKLVKDGLTIDVLEDTEFLIEKLLEPPKLLSFANELKKLGMPIGRVKNIDQLAKEINKYKK
ncbi:MAG: energy-coupling factor transporter ATPase [Mycoplasmataceae bacterium]|nr:energy-coupling factor transporter ATPase [Mycoplasmataceae bacterium]